jgi:hypothetical protein
MLPTWAGCATAACALAAVGSAHPPAIGQPQPGSAFTVVAKSADLVKAFARIGPEGATIVLRPGAYRITAPLVIRGSHVNIQGAGWNTTIQRIGAGDALVFKDAGFCTVRDLLINGDASARSGNGIAFRGQSSSCTVDFCRISNFAESGVSFEGDAKRPQSSNTVSRCHFIDNGGDQLRSVSNNDFYILQNQFGAHTRTGARAPRSGTALWPSSAGSYSLNYHWGNRVALRVGPGSHFNRFENNRFEQSRETGVLIGEANAAGCYLNILTGNTFHTNSEEKSGAWPAVEAHGACETTFTSNQVFSWDSATVRHRHSLVLGAGCRNWIVKDNVFRHNVERAIVFDEKAEHIVKDNIGE